MKADNNNAEASRELLAHVRDPDILDDMLAVYCELYIAQGADTAQADDQGYTALDWLAATEHYRTLKIVTESLMEQYAHRPDIVRRILLKAIDFTTCHAVSGYLSDCLQRAGQRPPSPPSP